MPTELSDADQALIAAETPSFKNDSEEQDTMVLESVSPNSINHLVKEHVYTA
jgi:hypothetical protein